jgi:hypothetical protein
MSKKLSGPFAVRSLGRAAWLLTTAAADGPQILLLLETATGAAGLPVDAAIETVALNWRHDGVEVMLALPTGVRSLRAASAIVHEPNARLYQSLPLAGFDEDARRFWRRVFRLIRIPGGRLLLGMIARRRRSGTGKR